MRRLILLLAVAAALCGCGPTNDTTAVRATLQTMSGAIGSKDYATLCNRVFAPALMAPALRLGLTCESVLARGFGAARHPRMVVQSVSVSGARAVARVYTSAANQKPLDTSLQLHKIAGHWYVTSLLQ